jgi:VWFA-related protein
LVEAQTTGGLIQRTPESAEQTRRSEHRVTLDVQVTDASGKPVSGLGQQDLTILDNGFPQTVTSFREIDGSTVPAPTEAILLLDTMNATLADVVIERQGIDKFLRQNGGHLALPVSIVFLADTGVKLNKASQDGTSLAEDLKKLQTPMRVLNSAQGAEGAQDRSQRSLRALQMLSTYEAARPGRKLLIWVGPGWPLLSRSTAQVSAKDQRRYSKAAISWSRVVMIVSMGGGSIRRWFSRAPADEAVLMSASGRFKEYEWTSRGPQREGDNVNTFVIALLLIVSFLTFGATMLIRYPQKADAFLNSDEPVESKHVVTRELSQKQGPAANAGLYKRD